MKTEADYKALFTELRTIEERTGLYLCDENVDHENVGETFQRDTAAYWDQMYFAACNAAGSRAEQEGANINTLLNRCIY